MSSWGNNDNAANAPHWAVNSTITYGAGVAASAARATAANVAFLYGNTTPNVYIQDATVGLYAVDNQEIGAAEAIAHPTHSGWILRTTGSGGRAGRVTHEVLVALANVIGDGDGQFYANVAIDVTTFTTSQTVTHSSSNANSAIFTVSPILTGNTSAALTYQWQVNSNTGGLGWTNVANNTPTATGYLGGTTNTLSVYPYNATANAYVFRVKVTAADEGVSATSANATITIL